MTIKKETKKIEAYTTPKNSSIGSIGDLIAGPFIAGKKKRFAWQIPNRIHETMV